MSFNSKPVRQDAAISAMQGSGWVIVSLYVCMAKTALFLSFSHDCSALSELSLGVHKTLNRHAFYKGCWLERLMYHLICLTLQQ